MQKFNIDSWFMAIIRWCSGFDRSYFRCKEWDTCSFFWFVVGALLNGIAKIIIGSGVLAAIFACCFAIGAGIAQWFTGATQPTFWSWGTPVMAIIGLTFMVCVAAIALGAIFGWQWAKSKWNERAYANWEKGLSEEPKKEPSLLVVLYRSWKDKFCTKITFK